MTFRVPGYCPVTVGGAPLWHPRRLAWTPRVADVIPRRETFQVGPIPRAVGRMLGTREAMRNPGAVRPVSGHGWRQTDMWFRLLAVVVEAVTTAVRLRELSADYAATAPADRTETRPVEPQPPPPATLDVLTTCVLTAAPPPPWAHDATASARRTIRPALHPAR